MMSNTAHALSPHPAAAAPEAGLVAALCELIDAVDRRVPHAERASELHIAKVAAAMRSDAVRRLEELKLPECAAQVRDQQIVDAVMSDDGGPPADPPSPRGPLG